MELISENDYLKEQVGVISPNSPFAYIKANIFEEVMRVSSYIEKLKKWCDDFLKKLEDHHEQLNTKISESTLISWKKELSQLREELEQGTTEIETIAERAKQLYQKITQKLQQMNLFREESFYSVPIGGHQLPPLPYPYDALEPYIDEETMRLHHDKHHQSYVNGLNHAELELEKARRTGDFSLIKHWERELAFHGAGHYLHTIFWSVMSPHGGGGPKGNLNQAINEAFGSFSAFKRQFSEAANNVEGGGWALLVWSPRAQRLEILTAEKHQNLTQWDVIPLLVLDVWEHAYYLKYRNERNRYVENWWNVVNWPEVERRWGKARQLQWDPY